MTFEISMKSVSQHPLYERLACALRLVSPAPEVMLALFPLMSQGHALSLISLDITAALIYSGYLSNKAAIEQCIKCFSIDKKYDNICVILQNYIDNPHDMW